MSDRFFRIAFQAWISEAKGYMQRNVGCVHRTSELLSWSVSKLRPTSHTTTSSNLQSILFYPLQPYICQGLVCLGQIHFKPIFHFFPLYCLTSKSTIVNKGKPKRKKHRPGVCPTDIRTSTCGGRGGCAFCEGSGNGALYFFTAISN